MPLNEYVAAWRVAFDVGPEEDVRAVADKAIAYWSDDPTRPLTAEDVEHCRSQINDAVDAVVALRPRVGLAISVELEGLTNTHPGDRMESNPDHNVRSRVNVRVEQWPGQL